MNQDEPARPGDDDEPSVEELRARKAARAARIRAAADSYGQDDTQFAKKRPESDD